MRLHSWVRPGLLGAALTAVGGAGAAWAATGQPEPWGLLLQKPATGLMGQLVWFEVYTRWIMIAITLLVLVLILVVMLRFNARRNPNPSRTSHNTMIEVIWTIVPVLVLVAIAFPGFRLLYNQTTIPEPGMTIKANGAQWYWNYEYMDDDLADVPVITSYMLSDDDRAERIAEYDLQPGEVPRLLAVDYPLVVPEDTVVHMLVTSNDVIHAVAMPSFGIKTDAVQGRINENWFQADEPGVYYGQCSELCGRSHAFMPLEFRVVTKERFAEWVELAKEDLDAATAQLIEWQKADRELAVAELNGQ